MERDLRKDHEMDFNQLASGQGGTPELGSPHDYTSPQTIAQHQFGGLDLSGPYDVNGRMNDLTRQDGGYEGLEPGVGRAQYMGETPVHQSSLFGQRLRRGFSRLAEAFEPDEAEQEQKQEDQAPAQPAQSTAPQEQPHEDQAPAFARSPAAPLGTHQIHAYGPSGAIRTPGTRSTGTSYDAYGR